MKNSMIVLGLIVLMVPALAIADGTLVSDQVNAAQKNKFNEALKKSVLGVSIPQVKAAPTGAPVAPGKKQKKNVTAPAQVGQDAPAGANSAVTNSDPLKTRYRKQ